MRPEPVGRPLSECFLRPVPVLALACIPSFRSSISLLALLAESIPSPVTLRCVHQYRPSPSHHPPWTPISEFVSGLFTHGPAAVCSESSQTACSETGFRSCHSSAVWFLIGLPCDAGVPVCSLSASAAHGPHRLCAVGLCLPSSAQRCPCTGLCGDALPGA